MGSADRFSTPANATFVPLRRSSIDAWLNMRRSRVPFQPIPMKPPSAHDPGALKVAPWSMSRGPWTVFSAYDTRDTAFRIMDHAPTMI